MPNHPENHELADFIAQHAKPYDPANDTYRRPPFAVPTKAGKATAIYNAHSYHTKVPPQGIEPYIAHYTDPGDLILDPFCGSGMTGVAVLMQNRKVILNDLSPAASHIAYNYCTPIDINAMKIEFEKIKSNVQDEFNWLYSTTCDRCGGQATIHYTIWSDILQCDRCSSELILWDLAVDPDSGKVKEKFNCPQCGKQHSKLGLQWLRSEPVITKYDCPHCKPCRSAHSTTVAEKQRISEIDNAKIIYWYPTNPFDESWEMWRGVHGNHGINDVSKFYTKRNLRAIARWWNEVDKIENPRIASAIRFLITSIYRRSSIMTTWNILRLGQASMSGTLYIPSLMVENNILELL